MRSSVSLHFYNQRTKTTQMRSHLGCFYPCTLYRSLIETYTTQISSCRRIPYPASSRPADYCIEWSRPFPTRFFKIKTTCQNRSFCLLLVHTLDIPLSETVPARFGTYFFPSERNIKVRLRQAVAGNSPPDCCI